MIRRKTVRKENLATTGGHEVTVALVRVMIDSRTDLCFEVTVQNAGSREKQIIGRSEQPVAAMTAFNESVAGIRAAGDPGDKWGRRAKATAQRVSTSETAAKSELPTDSEGNLPKKQSRGGSVYAFSVGLPGLGKRRR